VPPVVPPVVPPAGAVPPSVPPVVAPSWLWPALQPPAPQLPEPSDAPPDVVVVLEVAVSEVVELDELEPEPLPPPQAVRPSSAVAATARDFFVVPFMSAPWIPSQRGKRAEHPTRTTLWGYNFAGPHMSEREAHRLLQEANTLAAAGRYEDAIRAYEQAIALHSPLRGYRLVVGELLFELQEYQLAAEVFEDVALAEPDRAEAFEALGRARLLLGDSFGAIAAFERALRGAPNWAQPAWQLALLYDEAGQRAVARERLVLALHAEPSLREAARDEGLLARLEVP
jgi:tetratricopeptide (TPR) repeat protein